MPKKPSRVDEALGRRQSERAATQQGDAVEFAGDTNAQTMTLYATQPIRTVEDALTKGAVDVAIWEVERFVLNSWEVGARGPDKKIRVTPLWQVKVWLKRKAPAIIALAEIIERLAKHRKPFATKRLPKFKRGAQRRSLEVCVMDPHYGMRCHKPSSDHAWDLEKCEEYCMWSIESLVTQAAALGPFEQVVFPFGNDFLHSDNVFHTTTAGTAQPESESWLHIYAEGLKLAVAMVERLRKIAPVHIYQIPGNHSRQSDFTMGMYLGAWYRHDADVTVNDSSDPYKFHRFGTNLIGFEHGHSVKPIRLAALMANERRDDWAATSYREWHLGDQHRKGSGKPSMHEEQGVSVEYLPGLTPPNEWHRLKSFNWQKRGAMAFVWDYHRGPLARLQVNVDSYTGKPTGET